MAVPSYSFSKKPPKAEEAPAAKQPEAQAPARPMSGPQPANSGPVPYSQLITKEARSMPGMFTVHYIRDRYYFEIPDSLTGRDILAVTRIRRAPAEINKLNTGYPGDEVNKDVVQFIMGPNNKMYVCESVYKEYAADSSGLANAVSRANMAPVVMSFDIKAFNTDSTRRRANFVIDVTDYITKSDKGIFAFNEQIRKKAGLGAILSDASIILSLKTFPINIEFRTLKTFVRTMPPPDDKRAEAIYYSSAPTLTYELNTSLVLLPEKPMKSRLADARVGYFASGYTVYDYNDIERRARISHWRMEPRPEDEAKYLAGELVEPAKPIIIYIDPATPKKWVPYLIQGVNDWQEAFETAGFKNAIRAEEAPKDDASWSLDDARHSALVYKASDFTNASGPCITDPRSGEIMETHINWYHNIQQILREWYTVQVAAIDPRARKPMFDDELMGELIRFVASHEVGHTLGLTHNFGSSATVPVEKLRDKAWVEANGHTPSIMDYARFNYVAQPEDNISAKGIFPRIGMYDKWAIDWGYRWLPQFKTAEEEEVFQSKRIVEKLAEDKRYAFGGETDPNDPRNQSEDLGDNAMLANGYGILNLQRIVPNITEWMKEPEKDHSIAHSLYKQVLSQYSRYMGHVATYVGGVYSTPVASDSDGKASEFVPAALQRQAMDFLDKQLFATPKWLVDKKLIESGATDPVLSIASVQARTLDRLLSRNVVDCLARYEAFEGKSAYTAQEMFASLRKSIMAELSSGATPDLYRRNLQEVYVKALISLSGNKDISSALTAAMSRSASSLQSQPPSDAPRLALAQLNDLARELKTKSASAGGAARAHYMNLYTMIDKALKAE